MAIVTSAHGAATTKATRLVPKPTIEPINGTTSASTWSGARTILTPIYIIRKPTRRRIQAIIMLPRSAAAKTPAASTAPDMT